ncbi:MAG: hypothetical protein AB7Q97_06760 [Gammaproteobacteria bacterium]
MRNFDVHTRDVAPWHALITVAEAQEQHCLAPDLSGYLATMLLRYIGRPEFLHDACARQYIGTALAGDQMPHQSLRDLADRCLLFAGLFPDMVLQGGTPVRRYVELGRGAYERLGGAGGIYARVCEHFVELMDVLQSIREMQAAGPNLDPLATYDLWSSTGSRHAWRNLVTRNGALPVLDEHPQRH